MSNTTMSAEKAHETITQAAEAASPDVRDQRSLPIGKGVRQGDVYLVRVDFARRGDALQTRQLVDGTSQGSRHVAEGAVRLCAEQGYRPRGVSRDCLLGPVVVADDEWVLTHPEHAHYRLPAGEYVVVHQMDPRTLSRVQD